jgi:hypothetical protein
MPLRLAEQQAVLEFARRLPTWTDERAKEIAEAARVNDDRASLGRLFGLRMLVPGFIGAVH